MTAQRREQSPTPNQEAALNWYLLGDIKISYLQWNDAGFINHTPGPTLWTSWPPKMYCIYAFVGVVGVVWCLGALLFVLLCFGLVGFRVSEREQELSFISVRLGGKTDLGGHGRGERV